MHIWKREFLFNILKIALKSLKKWVHHCLFNVYLTKMDSTDILKNVPVSLGSSNISLEKERGIEAIICTNLIYSSGLGRSMQYFSLVYRKEMQQAILGLHVF